MRGTAVFFFSGLIALVCGCVVNADDGIIGDDGVESEVLEVAQPVTALKGIILIDRTGSMLTTRSTGRSRCRDARTMAQTKVTEFFSKYDGGGLAIWTFNGAGVTKLTNGYVGAAEASAAIDALSPDGCTGGTPLADAICAAADELNDLKGPPTTPNLLTILTDGADNMSTGPCRGVASGGISNPLSWQFKARSRISPYFPHVQVNAQFWTGNQFINLRSPTGPSVPQASSSLLPMAPPTCTTLEQCESEFFLALTSDTGGTYDRVQDNNVAFPCSYGACPTPQFETIDW
ncbi:VWA domain-containing protein [Chondromyces crocatus]|uniref:Uncharacterized protein n=1 Tax=Chondromyces crocatus TaxID=52 RepID=A0A0K1EAY4_CHOCO|nr:VWA domain-containing protein [Chondromyces crocatus]AKT37842.1 uncharacterized protein CMC5_019850 [Chondromyces crocatus]